MGFSGGSTSNSVKKDEKKKIMWTRNERLQIRTEQIRTERFCVFHLSLADGHHLTLLRWLTHWRCALEQPLGKRYLQRCTRSRYCTSAGYIQILQLHPPRALGESGNLANLTLLTPGTYPLGHSDGAAPLPFIILPSHPHPHPPSQPVWDPSSLAHTLHHPSSFLFLSSSLTLPSPFHSTKKYTESANLSTSPSHEPLLSVRRRQDSGLSRASLYSFLPPISSQLAAV